MHVGLLDLIGYTNLNFNEKSKYCDHSATVLDSRIKFGMMTYINTPEATV